MPGFDKAAVAPRRAAAGTDGSQIVGGVIGPYDDPATITAIGGIGVDERAGGNARKPGIGDRWVSALIITANKNGAAAESAGHVDGGGVEHCHRFAEHTHLTAAAS
jgi:hypothetical protein